MRENLRIGRWPFDMDHFGYVHLDDANYAGVRCKRNSDGRSLSTRRAHESHVRDSGVPYAILSVRSSEYEIVLSMEGPRGSNLSPFPSETDHPPRREEGLPTFTLEKLVPGGIAEVSP